MGSYAFFRIGGYEIFSDYAYVDPVVGALFAGCKKLAIQEKADEDYPTDWTRHAYRCSGRIVADRLDALGFTASRTRREFEEWRRAEIAEINGRLDGLSSEEREAPQEFDLDRRSLFTRLTFDVWSSTVGSLLRRRIYRWQRGEVALSEYERFIFQDDEILFGYPISDRRFLLRALLLVHEPDVDVELDLTDVLDAGYYEAADDVPGDCQRALAVESVLGKPIVVVAEGSTDIAILRCALDNVFPHLREYCTFFDHGGTRSRGGASAVVETVKAFVAARVSDRIVALVDNDTAGHEALRGLRGVALPHNIRCMTYPDLDLAMDYPTLGPGGPLNLNVNGLAGSIELYLGADVLKDEDNGLMPVQWRGFSEALQRYQGELLNKSVAQDRFFGAVTAWKDQPEAHPERDWSGLTSILNRVLQAHIDPAA